jgi:hypothetical protein
LCIIAVRRLVFAPEAEHRSTFYIPYWNVPLLRAIVPRQRQFGADIKVINDCLDSLITLARSVALEQDEEALQNRDYTQVLYRMRLILTPAHTTLLPS